MSNVPAPESPLVLNFLSHINKLSSTNFERISKAWYESGNKSKQKQLALQEILNGLQENEAQLLSDLMATLNENIWLSNPNESASGAWNMGFPSMRANPDEMNLKVNVMLPIVAAVLALHLRDTLPKNDFDLLFESWATGSETNKPH